MYYILRAWDDPSPETLQRRTEVRPRHIKTARESLGEGEMLIGGAALDENGAMSGSLTVVFFAEHAAFETWLEGLPYNQSKIWKKIDVTRYMPAVFNGSRISGDPDGPAYHNASNTLMAEMKRLENENDQLRKLVADLSPDRALSQAEVSKVS